MNSRACLLGVLGLTACASITPPAAPPVAVVAPQPAPPPPPAPVVKPCPPTPAVLDLLDYYQRVRQLGAAELQREQQVVLAAAGSVPRDVQIVQLAMLALQMRAAGDWSRLLPQVEAIARGREEAGPGVRPLAQLLLAGQQEIRRLEEQSDKLTQQLRDEQKRREAAESREAALQDKLEGLKAIERNLLNRPQGK